MPPCWPFFALTDFATVVAVHRSLAAIGLSLALCRGQQGALPTFGTTVVIAGGMTGKVYHIPFESTRLPKFENLEPVGTIYTRSLWLPSREFSEGFPGITSRIEWFALDFTGRIYIQTPGTYTFSLCSDDGSKLYIDTKTVIDNDGIHGEECRQVGLKLSGGIHAIRDFLLPGAALPPQSDARHCRAKRQALPPVQYRRVSTAIRSRRLEVRKPRHSPASPGSQRRTHPPA